MTARGDDYLTDVANHDRPNLYPYASLLHAGVQVAPSSDAPFGDLDPWQTIAAAASRCTQSGAILGGDERVATATALAGYLSPLDNPGGPRRRVAPDTPSDLCLLYAPLGQVLDEPSATFVRLVIRAGQVIHAA
ncbi:MAG: hypothetical protein QOE61_4406 [Micromonosporaceae bacterium]|nr:hypothetical protein [Micromonosporaceae bacterium]